MKNKFFQKVGLGFYFIFFRIFVGKLGPTFCDLLMLRLVKMGLVFGWANELRFGVQTERLFHFVRIFISGQAQVSPTKTHVAVHKTWASPLVFLSNPLGLHLPRKTNVSKWLFLPSEPSCLYIFQTTKQISPHKCPTETLLWHRKAAFYQYTRWCVSASALNCFKTSF